VIVPEATPAQRVEAEIRAAGGTLLREVNLFDLYHGESLPAGTRSLAYHLCYQADRTLTDKEIEKAHKGIENRLRHVLGAQIRGQDA
jgi:phenylalanyl-tRNA synthetase beta chain